ncbi:MAG: hypothetical protein FJ387_03545 [Verrucomicrobia bacterium]|nr:hypothetical protein [Verrucomicrobiota bacterium]
MLSHLTFPLQLRPRALQLAPQPPTSARSRRIGPVLHLALAILLPHVTAEVASAAVDSPLAKLPQLEYGQDQSALAALDLAVRAAHRDPDLRRDLEARLIQVLTGPASAAAKDYACRQLKLIATAASVPALTQLLADPQLSSLARYTLESIPEAAVDQALCAALPGLAGRPQLGAIGTLGERRAAQAVPSLLPVLQGPDLRAAAAAATALGKIATPEAATALATARTTVHEALRATVDCAAIDAAHRLLAAGNSAAAAKLFQELFLAHTTGHIRLAAFQGYAASQGDDALGVLFAPLTGLKNRPQGELEARLAGRLLAEWTWLKIPSGYLNGLATDALAPRAKVILLGALKTRGDPGARTAVLSALSSPVAEVRLAAIETLGVLGTAADIPPLASVAATGPAPERQIALQSLASLPGSAVHEQVVNLLADTPPATRAVLLRTLATRGATDAAAAVVKYVGDEDRGVRQAALEAAGLVGGVSEIPPLVQQLAAASTEAQRETLGDALVSICSRARQQSSPTILESYQTAQPASRPVLLRVLSSVGGSEALATVRAATRDSSPEVQDAAIRALADWADPAAAPDLLELVRTADNSALRTLAFRGYVRLGRESEAPADAKVKLLDNALAVAQTVNDRRLVLGALGDVRSLAALRLAAQQLDQPDLADEAGAAVVKIATLLEPPDKAEASAALEQVLKSARAKSVLDDARRQLRGL